MKFPTQKSSLFKNQALPSLTISTELGSFLELRLQIKSAKTALMYSRSSLTSRILTITLNVKCKVVLQQFLPAKRGKSTKAARE